MPTKKTPGVYVQEISSFPPSIAQVETAIPAFIGFTEIAKKDTHDDLLHKPYKISSMQDYEIHFGLPQKETSLNILVANNQISVLGPDQSQKSPFLMHYALQIFYANGGGDCYIVSAGQYGEDRTNAIQSVEFIGLQNALTALEKSDEPTLIVFPDATLLPTDSDFHSLINTALIQCHKLGNRFVITETYRDEIYDNKDPIESFRNGINLGTEYLKNGAAYFPFLKTILDYHYDEDLIEVEGISPSKITLTDLNVSNPLLYKQIKTEITKLPVILPPSSALAGIYTRVDAERGVWKSPANVGVNYVIEPTIPVSHEAQETLNVDPIVGKSINAIRTFTGKGTLVWGARTLAGNDNEWRYVSVRRLFITLKKSINKALIPFIFESNDQNTWVRVKTMINNYLITLWKSGALAGAKPDHAFYISIGLNKTMTAQDILEGRMIIEIGMAAVRPAEFIILKFSQKMQVA